MPESTIAAALSRQTVVFKDCDGVAHAAPSLTLTDLADMEERFGPMAGWGEVIRDPKAARAFLWHSLRKEGITRDAVRKRAWVVSEEDVGEMFLVGDLPRIMELLFAILRASGLDVGLPTALPRPQVPAPTGEPSSALSSPSVSPATT